MKLFVGTRRKVGCGSMYGKWLDLDAFADEEEFLLACRKIHWEEKNPQFVFLWCKFIHGWELALFEKYSPPFGYWEVKQELKKQFFDEDVFSSFAFIRSEFPSVHLVRQCAASYLGEFGSLENYLQWYCINELGYSTADLQGGTVDFGRFSENVACVDGYIFQS